jgi:hypothetical protein
MPIAAAWSADRGSVGGIESSIIGHSKLPRSIDPFAFLEETRP